MATEEEDDQRTPGKKRSEEGYVDNRIEVQLHGGRWRQNRAGWKRVVCSICYIGSEMASSK